MSKSDAGYRVEYVALSEIQRWPKNPKLHDEPGIDASLERWGFTNPLLIDERSGQLVAGHGRLEALQRRKAAAKSPPGNIAVAGGEWMVPVVRGVSFKNTAEAEAYLGPINTIVILHRANVQAAINRWEHFTGQKAQKLSGEGKTT